MRLTKRWRFLITKIFISVRQLIKKILKEETQKNMSSKIKELLNMNIDPKFKGIICKFDAVAPWEMFEDPTNRDYQVMVSVIGGLGSNRFPVTQNIIKERDDIVNDVWNTIYNYLGISTDVFLRNVKSCDEVITESIEDIQGTPLYHHTSESRSLSIMNSDMLRGSRPDDDILAVDPTLFNTPHQSMVSLSRDKNFVPDDSIGAGAGGFGDSNKPKVIFVVDKDKLKTSYKIVQFDYSASEDRWYDKRMKDDPDTIMFPRAIRKSKSNEYEERVLTNKIEPLRRYIIDIIYKGDNPLVQEKINEYLNRDRQVS